jgi:hypothetical protein
LLKKMIVICSLALGGFAINSASASSAPSPLPQAAAAVETLGTTAQYAQYYYGPPRRRYVPRRYVPPRRYYGRRYYAPPRRYYGRRYYGPPVGRPAPRRYYRY